MSRLTADATGRRCVFVGDGTADSCGAASLPADDDVMFARHVPGGVGERLRELLEKTPPRARVLYWQQAPDLRRLFTEVFQLPPRRTVSAEFRALSLRRVVQLRHGHSTANEADVISSSLPEPAHLTGLSALGREQAKAAAAQLEQLRVQRGLGRVVFLTSPFSRRCVVRGCVVIVSRFARSFAAAVG